MPNEIIATIEDAARLCGIKLNKDRGEDLPPELAQVIREWFQNELFCRPKNLVRPTLKALPPFYKSYLTFILLDARDKAMKLRPDVPVVLHYGMAGYLTDILAGRLNCQMLV